MITRLIATSTARSLAAAALLVFALGLTGCNSGDENKNPVGPGGSSGSTVMTGTFTGANENGRVGLTIHATSLAHMPGAGKATVIGSAVLNVDAGTTVDLSGTYDPATDSLFVTGGGYTLVGKLRMEGFLPAIAGVYVGPNGSGTFEVLVGSQNEIGVYCGTYLNSVLVQQGRWSFLLFQNRVIGLQSPESGGFIRMTGDATGTGPTKTLTFTSDPEFGSMTATGTVNTQTHHASGNWTMTDDAGTESGTWTAEYCENGTSEEAARMAP